MSRMTISESEKRRILNLHGSNFKGSIISEIYDPGTKVTLTKNNVKITYTIDQVDSLQGQPFRVVLKTPDGKLEEYTDITINKITDDNFKNGLLAIRKAKMS